MLRCMIPRQAMDIIERRAFLRSFDHGQSFDAEAARLRVRGCNKKDVRYGGGGESSQGGAAAWGLGSLCPVGSLLKLYPSCCS